MRAIARAGTGVDNVDVVAASERGIVVMNAPGANSISVAELAMAQILALARRAGLLRSRCLLGDTRLVLAYLALLVLAGAAGLWWWIR